MNAYLKRQHERDVALVNAARQTYLQFAVDMLSLALHDKDVMGNDAFGSGRIVKVIDAAGKNYDTFIEALDGKSHDADYLRVKLDEALADIYGEDKIIKFSDRYDYISDLCEIGKERKK